MKPVVSALILAIVLAAPGVAQGLSAAQQNYKACPGDAKKRGIEAVKSLCGEAPIKPVQLPSYEEAYNSITTTQLAKYEEMLVQLRSEVNRYKNCINSRVMSNGSLPTATLDLAACADQFAVVDQLGAMQEEWTLACYAHNFSENMQQYPRNCSPTAD
jgi:hypothetical protein